MKRIVVFLITLLMLALTLPSAFSQEIDSSYGLGPLRVVEIEKNVDTNKSDISELKDYLERIDARLQRLESKGTERLVSQPARVVEKPVVVQRTAPVVRTSTHRRLKTPGEIQNELRSKWTNRTYADISPKTSAWATRHLLMSAPDHTYVYQPSQLVGLSYNELWMLHNINHAGSIAINPYTQGAVTQPIVQPADFFEPTPQPNPSSPVPSPAPRYNNGCPNGRCPTAGATTNTGWYFGKRLGW